VDFDSDRAAYLARIGKRRGVNLHLALGGRLTGLALAVNWCATSYSRVSANFVSADLRDVGSVPIFQMRLPFDI